jgi:hypothetical protein
LLKGEGCEPRKIVTIDIDLNVFVDAARSRDVVAALPDAVTFVERQLKVLERDGQMRLWWERTPLARSISEARD